MVSLISLIAQECSWNGPQTQLRDRSQYGQFPGEPAACFPGEPPRNGPGEDMVSFPLEDVVKENVREAHRNRGNLTQQQLAKKLGKAVNTVKRMLRP